MICTEDLTDEICDPTPCHFLGSAHTTSRLPRGAKELTCLGQRLPTWDDQIGGDLSVGRIGFGAMQLTGEQVWAEYPDHDGGVALLRHVVDSGVTRDGVIPSAPSSRSFCLQASWSATLQFHAFRLLA
jgi:hypothetical protein